MIDAYRFGSITVQGKTYTQDVVLYPDRVQDSWWRERGHELGMEDIDEVLAGRPEVLIIGTGASGRMYVPHELQEEIRKRGIRLFVAPTGEAVKLYNQLAGTGRTVAALHLTC
ncbi:MAG: Mth938-like domain-containing protein [Spirochaetota bacterium]